MMGQPKRRAVCFIAAIWHHRTLALRLTKREIQSRYEGSALGMAWTMINPLIMLAVYTFVFAAIFKARWGPSGGSTPAEFALNLFAGLITFGLFGECIARSPLLVVANPNYVTKLIFPVEILPAVCLGASLFHAGCSLFVLELFQLIIHGSIPATSLWLPLVWLPLICLTLAGSWTLAALGVYLRDLEQAIGSLVSILMFMSAVFYPINAIPDKWQPLLALNPLAALIDQTRKVLIQGTPPAGFSLAFQIMLALAVCELSFRLFQRARRGFADVL